jgi:hypothetical protein
MCVISFVQPIILNLITLTISGEQHKLPLCQYALFSILLLLPSF